jgi:hypothetical protein
VSAPGTSRRKIGATRSGGIDSWSAVKASSRNGLLAPSISGNRSGSKTMRPVSIEALAAMAAAMISPWARRLSRFASINQA